MRSSSSAGSRRSLNSHITSFSAKILVLTTFLIPYHSIGANKVDQYQTVLNSNKLTVVAVANPSAVFEQGQFQYGFGYDLVRNYAQNLDVELEFTTVADNATALKWVSQGKANFAMTTADINQVESKKLTAFSVSCGDLNTLSRNGLDSELNWVFKRAEDPLTEIASGYVCQSQQNGKLNQLASFYNRNVVKDRDWDRIQQNLKSRMPIYKASFKQSAQKYDLDWHLLAAIGYQESFLNPNSVSPTGVRGLMMLTNNTARAMGVSNRTDATQSIQGGAKYYDQMLSKYDDIPFPDRNWFALAAYNMGPGTVDGIQKQLKKQGKNPDNWMNFYDHLERNQLRNSRYKQAVQYVTRIRSYLEHIKTTPKLLEI
ncbi:transglycosylase-like protein with SLT domain [Acinetobacter calcoaceticus]|uniref:Transglycosylase-like protein with SLT domain n=1 Tax=Acinetobacter calcoaceticus TaxID=471 RepID=A0A4R1XVR4_ACICA|nr:transglycosylase-like protein with SLT domain [Acinetobacter calcoaceticus]